LTLHGDLYHVVPKSPAPEITRLTADGGPKLDVRGSPRGTMASYVKDNEVYAALVKTRTTRKLTQGATATLHHGVAEFVAQEEMGRFDGHWWSKDERYLAYTEVDVSPVGIKRRPRMHADRADIMEQRYPATGEANARISVRVLDLQTSTDVKLATPAEDGYIPRVDWFGAHTLYVQWQSRDQRLLVLFSAEPPRFRLKKVLEETDETWVDLHHDLRVLRDGTVLWPSERSGIRQLYRVAKDGPWTALTRSPDPVTHVVAVDEDRGLLFYERATNRARERQLFSVPLAGGTETQLTHGPGIHSVAGHREGKAFIESVSDLKTPWRTRILDGNATLLRELEPGVEAPWNQLRLPQTEWVTVKAEDGAELNGLLVYPLKREAGQRYPVVVSVYGGPGVQRVVNGFGVLSTFMVYLSQQGFGVFALDNRGTPNRGRTFGRKIHKRVADIDVRDQLAGVAFLQQLPWVDRDRIGVYGWSYGGTMTALLLTEKNTPFAAGISGAPVTDWRLYDTHYTERYLGKPQDDPVAYERTDVVRRAGNLEKPLLLVHGTADDNVLFENTLRFAEALQKKSIPFELMIYPGHAHGLQGREAQLHFLRTMVRFLARELRASVDPMSF
jgi:dipeptidyl-peptidase 4